MILIDFIVDDDTPDNVEAAPNDDASNDGIDTGNIVLGKRRRKQTQFYENEVFGSEEYRKMMVSEVIALQSKSPEDIPCEIVIRTDKYLPSYDAEKKSGYIGGFIMTAKKDKITLQQTLDDRVKLCQEIAVPTIRYMLFPAMRAKKWASSVYKEHCIII